MSSPSRLAALPKRWLWAALILVLLVLLSFLVPSPSQDQGSTYSRAPGGYGAWYAYMESRHSMRRWQRPLEDLESQPPLPPTQKIALKSPSPSPTPFPHLPTSSSPPSPSFPTTPITLVRINSPEPGVSEAWVRRGNVLVLVGRRAPVTEAPFRQAIDSPDGAVQIATSRRFPSRDPGASPLLEDSFGVVVQRRQVGQGHVIAVVTPFLAANAYQDTAGNFKFLERLVTEPDQPIYIDEYLHGYRDQEEQTENAPRSWIGYFARTPLLLLAVQAGILVLLLMWGQGQRLGPPQPLPEPSFDNSTAYIQALAGVLQKANCDDFVVQTIGRAERIQLQRRLGLGAELLEPQTVIDAWVKQTGRPAAELEPLLRPPARPKLSRWLAELQGLRRNPLQ